MCYTRTNLVAEAGFEPARTFWVQRAYETLELDLCSTPRHVIILLDPVNAICIDYYPTHFFIEQITLPSSLLAWVDEPRSKLLAPHDGILLWNGWRELRPRLRVGNAA